MIVQVADEQHKREIKDASAIVEVCHNIFDDYSCSQHIRIYMEPRGSGIRVVYKGATFRFPNARDFLATGCDMILQTMLYDFTNISGAEQYTDLHFISMHVHHKKQRLSILHHYFDSEIYQHQITDFTEWRKDKQLRQLKTAFRRQVMFALRLV
jgi:hypothetical protein